MPSSKTVSRLAGVALAIGFVMPAFAQATPPPAPAPAQIAVAAPAATPGGAISQADLLAAVGSKKADGVEKYVAKLHGDLKITAAQEPAWQDFAGLMRSNAADTETASGKSPQSYDGMSAVQILQSYIDYEQTTARSVARLMGPFQTLYDGFSPSQKKTADTIFARRIVKAEKKPG